MFAFFAIFFFECLCVGDVCECVCLRAFFFHSLSFQTRSLLSAIFFNFKLLFTFSFVYFLQYVYS